MNHEEGSQESFALINCGILDLIAKIVYSTQNDQIINISIAWAHDILVATPNQRNASFTSAHVSIYLYNSA